VTPAEEATLVDVSRDEMDAEFDALARRHLGMSGAEFAELVERGGPLPDHPMVGHLLLMIGAARAS
jgi:hypothetical protein